jgi:hypothetical protein
MHGQQNIKFVSMPVIYEADKSLGHTKAGSIHLSTLSAVEFIYGSKDQIYLLMLEKRGRCNIIQGISWRICTKIERLQSGYNSPGMVSNKMSSSKNRE